MRRAAALTTAALSATLSTSTLLLATLATTVHADGGARAQGLDVYEKNGKLDWAKLASAGVSFGIARVSDGAHHLDSRFAANWEGMGKAGVVRGAYQFLRSNESGLEQARVFLSNVAFEPGDLPPCLDVEVTDGESARVILREVGAWINEVKAGTGLTPMIYTTRGFWNELDAKEIPGGAGLWIANWGVSKPTLAHGWTEWTIWQYAETAKLSPDSGADADVFNGTVAELKAYAASQAPTLREGARGKAVTNLQEALAGAGFDPGSRDGSFGPATLAAVKAFETAHGLAADGVVTPAVASRITSGPESTATPPTATPGFVGKLAGE